MQMLEPQVYQGGGSYVTQQSQSSDEPRIEIEESGEDYARIVAGARTLILDVSGREGVITAADIQIPEHYEIVNPDLYLATVNAPDGRLYVEFSVEVGRGYVPAGQSIGLPIGVIPVDAIFSPVRRV